MRRFALFLLLPALLLAGCARQDPPQAETTPPPTETPMAGRPLTGEEVAQVNEAFLSHM